MEEIVTIEQMDALVRSSDPAILFKYSPTCGISQVAQEAWTEFTITAPGVRLAQCDVLAAKPAARGVVEMVGVAHQSPQVLVLSGGKCLAHTSHYSIKLKWLEEMRDRLVALSSNASV
ncbi:MAG: monothiol bacilliredoxin BrxC family protein [Fibrobacterota bacterium]